MIQGVNPPHPSKPVKPVAVRPAARGAAGLPATAVKTKVWLERDGQFAVGDGGLRLLLGILEHGSLLGAARQIRWSYRHAWGYLRRAEAALGTQLTKPRPGKGASRGTALTEAGRLVIERLAEIRNRIDDAVGPFGPTAADVASRGRRPRRELGVNRRGAPATAGKRASRGPRP
jgi:molybdate transport system regulatory protein